MKSFSPDTFGSVNGGTIFDDSLSLHLRYLRLSIIATLCAFAIYSLIKSKPIMRSPNPPPPLLIDSSWRTTSLREFWNHR
ncbi:hypothetical protein BDR06DRAFT_1050576 [Suillus hirtellus]|nr:hypothetical protein BDR06DRAFT_1050576 [Suillus hirtellus]